MSATIAYSKLGENSEYIGVSHQQPLPEMEKDSIVYLVDFAYPREITLELQQNHQEVIILDHHKTAQEQLLGIQGIAALFDLTKSGAMLTWEYFYPDTSAPYTVQLVQDRDLWQWQFTDTKPFTEALYNLREMNHPRNWLEVLFDNSVCQSLIEQGKTIAEVSQKQAEKQLQRMMYWGKLPRHEDLVPMINTSHLISETCQAMYNQYPEAPYVVCWYIVDEQVKISLRSSHTDINVGYIAREYGGGGHPAAAGATVSVQEWFR
jgi:oligoribonuclease NrnB/cAMP/cGMP phosphodiesterase (DHH superfamily)